MNKGIQIILVAFLLVTLIFLIMHYGFVVFVIVSSIGFVVVLLIEQAYKRKKKEE
jgi:hypothetical protein